jgi:hypothetical protein
LKLTRIKIDKYGPLNDLDLSIDPEFQCIYGPNECKTLIVEALLKMSFGRKKKSKLLSTVDRVKGKPKGWVSLLDGTDEIVVDDDKNLADTIGLTSEELIDIFVIRNSDLSFLDDTRCLGQVSEKILGLSSHQIDAIQNALRERGRITKTTGVLLSIGGEESPGKQVEIAKDLVEKIHKYVEETDQTGIAKCEAEVIRLESRRISAEKKIEELKAAQKLNRFRVIQSTVNEVNTLLAEEESMTNERKEQIRLLLDSCEKDGLRIPEVERTLQMFRRLAIAGSVGLSASAILSVFLAQNVFGIAQSLLLLIFTLIITSIWIKHSRQLSTIEQRRLNMVKLGQEYDLTCVDSLQARSVLVEKLRTAEDSTRYIGESIGRLMTHLGREKGKREQIMKLALEEIEKLRGEVDHSIKRRFLKDTFDKQEALLKRIDEELKKSRNTIKSHRERLHDIEKQALRIRFEMFLGVPMNLSVDSIDALSKLQGILEKLIATIENDAYCCREAVRVFNLLLRDEEDKVSELLSKGSRAADIFSEITRNNYVDVRYDTTERVIKAVKSNGREFVPENLSSGAKDQLYLSIRVALGERLLKGQQGFFVMDDPFIASDMDREERQAKVLSHLIRNGWQVVFFTARKNLAVSLTKTLGKKLIELKPLD